MLPRVAGLFVHPSRCTKSWPKCRRHPSHQLSSCLMSSTTRSCMDSSRGVWQLNKVSLSGPRLTVDWSLVRNLLPWHSMATSNVTSSMVQSPTRSSHSNVQENACRSTWMQALLCASAQKHMATTTENDHHCKNQRQSENKHHTDSCGTHFEVTSTSHYQNQQNHSFPMLTAALILSENNLNASFTEKHSKASSRECADTTSHSTI